MLPGHSIKREWSGPRQNYYFDIIDPPVFRSNDLGQLSSMISAPLKSLPLFEYANTHSDSYVSIDTFIRQDSGCYLLFLLIFSHRQWWYMTIVGQVDRLSLLENETRLVSSKHKFPMCIVLSKWLYLNYILYVHGGQNYLEEISSI